MPDNFISSDNEPMKPKRKRNRSRNLNSLRGIAEVLGVSHETVRRMMIKDDQEYAKVAGYGITREQWEAVLLKEAREQNAKREKYSKCDR